jgi:hypothetical protein
LLKPPPIPRQFHRPIGRKHRLKDRRDAIPTAHSSIRRPTTAKPPRNGRHNNSRNSPAYFAFLFVSPAPPLLTLVNPARLRAAAATTTPPSAARFAPPLPPPPAPPSPAIYRYRHHHSPSSRAPHLIRHRRALVPSAGRTGAFGVRCAFCLLLCRGSAS